MRVVCIWLALVATASAEPRTDAGLVWQAPATCPNSADVRTRIERRLGSSIDRVHGIEVEISPDGETFVARVDLRGVTVANDIRILTSARCEELTDAVAVIVARLAVEQRDAEPREEVEREMPAVYVRDATPEQHREWGGGLRLLGLSGVGALPRVSIGGEVAVYMRRRTVFFELGAAHWAASPEVLQPGAPGRVDVSLTTSEMRLGWGPERLPIRGWATFELGAIAGAGVSLDHPQFGTGRWTAAGAGFGVAWPITPHARLIGAVEFLAPLERPRFVLQDGTELYRPGSATARCDLGVEVGWR